MRYIYMSNLTPDDVDLRLTTVHNKLNEEDTRLWQGLADEKVSRIAGDEANKSLTLQVQTENQGTEGRLSTEVDHRAKGDLSTITSLNALDKALSEYKIKTDLQINNERILREQLGVDLDEKINLVQASFDHQYFIIHQTIDEVNKLHKEDMENMDIRIKKYEDMLQDITTDSIQITMDNGEINMGAWTILSQAREWDLEILAKFKGYTDKTDKDIQDALDDLISKLPVEQDIIDKAIEALSNAPIIKELDALLGSAIEDINRVDKGLIQEVTDRQNALIGMAQDNALKMQQQADELTSKIQKENDERVDAIQRESAVRQQELLDEAAARSAEIEEKIKNVNVDIDNDLLALNKRVDDVNNYANTIKADLSKEEAARIEGIKKLDDGLTTEADFRKKGDDANILALNNYKTSNDRALANVQEKVTANVTATEANATKITALDTRLTTNENLAASAVSKADTALSENKAQATQINQVKASIETINGELGKKADAQSLQVLDSKVTTLDGKVTSQGTALTLLENTVENLNVGSTNLLKNSGNMVNFDPWYLGKHTNITGDYKLDNGYFKFDITNSIGVGDIALKQTVPIERTDSHYTFSAWFTDIVGAVNAVGRLLIRFVFSDGTTKDTSNNTIITNGKHKVTADVPAGKELTTIQVWVYAYATGANAKISLKAGFLQLESGTFATDWYPNVAEFADARALTALTTTVDQQGKNITSNSNQLTSLTNRVTVAESNINKKADSSAITALDSKITVVDGKVTSNSNQITSLNNSLASALDNLVIKGYEEKSKVGGYLMLMYPLVRTLNEQDKKYTVRTKVSFKNGGISTANLRVYLGGRQAFNAGDPIYAADHAIFEYTLTSIAALNAANVSFYCFPNNADNAKAELTVHWVELYEGENIALNAKADAKAVTDLTNRVTQTENELTTQSQSITRLDNTLSLVGVSTNNLLMNSNVELPYNGDYPHGRYLLTEDWEVGAEYTLMWCAEHKRAAGDQFSSLQAYAGGGNQSVQTSVVNGGKVVNKVTFKKNEVGTARAVNFYMINKPSTASIGTVYWAVLVKGNKVLSDSWIPSSFEQLKDVEANSKAISILDSSVTSMNGTITAQGTQITKLETGLATANNNISKKADSSAVTALDSRVTTSEGKITSQGNQITELNATTSNIGTKVGNTISYTMLTNRNSLSLKGLRGIYAPDGNRAYAFARGFNLVRINSKNVLTVTHYDAYGDLPLAAANLDAAIKAIPNSEYFAVVGSDNVGAFGTSTDAAVVACRNTLISCGMDATEIKAWVSTNMPIFLSRREGNKDVSKYILLKSTDASDFLEYVLTLVNGVPSGIGDDSALIQAQDATAKAVTNLTATVTEQGKNITSNSSQITALNNRVTTTETNINKKADSSAVTSLDNKVTLIDGRVATNTSEITTLKSRVTTAEGNITKKADATALNTLTNRVTETEKGLTTQSDNLVLLTNTVTNMGSYVALNSDSEGLETYNTTGEIVKVADNNATAGRILKLGNNSGDDHVWIHPPYFMPFEPSRMYRVKARFRRVSGSGTVYVGIASKNADKSRYVTTANTYSLDMNSSTYLYAGQTPALGVWQELEFFVSGASTGAASGGVTLANPKKMPALAAFITPMFIANYQSAAGVVELDYVTIEQADAFPMLDAAATATSNLATKVDTVDGKVTSNSSNITNLTNRVNTVEGQVKTKAEASALTALDSRVTKAENNITSQSSSVTKLENRLDKFASNGTNMLANSNAVTPYDGNYPHCVYNLGTEWELNSTYTLVWCGEHKRASGDTTSVLAAYAGGGTQQVQAFPVNGAKQVVSVRFNKAASSSGKVINFYLLNRSSAATTATIYWAVLLKGNTEIVDAWIPSPFDYMNDTAALSKAQQVLDSKVTTIDGKVTANTASITTLQGRVTTAEGNINKKLDASVINAYSTTVETNKSIANAVSSFDASLVIGGNNLLYNTGPSVTTERAWTFGAASGLVGNNSIKDNGFYSELTGGTGTGDFSWKQTTPAVVKSGESATLSVYADIKGSVQARLLVRFNYADGTSSLYSPMITSSQRIVLTALNSAVQDSVSIHIWLTIYPLSAGAKGSCLFTRPMLEIGTKASAWNMGSADTDNSLTLNANAIKDTTARVTTTEAGVKANSSDITALSNNLNGANLLKPFPETVAVGQTYEQIAVPFKSPVTYVLGDKYVVRGSLSFAQNTLPAGAGIAVFIEGNPRFTTIPLMRQGNNQYFEGEVSIDASIAGRTASNLKLFLFPSGSSNSTTRTTLHWAELTQGGEVKASVAAVGSLETELNKQGGTINTLTNSTTRLESRVTTVEGKTESNIGAITTLNGKMTVAEGKIESNSTALTKVNASVSGLENDITVKDTRSVNSPPSFYWANYPTRVVNEFKQASVIGLTGMGTYVNLATTVSYKDSTGGPIQQRASNGNPELDSYRYSNGTTAWTAWGKPIKELQDGLGTKASSGAVSTLEAKVGVIDGKVSTQATSITQLQSDVGSNTSKLQVQGNVLNGIQAEYTIKTDVNGLVAGIGLINDGKSSAIGMNADYFYIGKPSANKKPFIVTTSSQTIGGVTYPAGTWIDVAFIANAVIGTAHIANAAITNAKIANLAVDNAKISNLSAEKINAGFLNADRIKAGSLNADKLSAAAIDTISISAHNGTFTAADGSRTVVTGGLTEIYYPNNKLAVKLGIW